MRRHRPVAPTDLQHQTHQTSGLAWDLAWDLPWDRAPLTRSQRWNQKSQVLRTQEVRMWYRIEWSPAVANQMDHNIRNAWNTGENHYFSFPMNVSDSFRTQAHGRNLGGTIRWVQRLRYEPSKW